MGEFWCPNLDHLLKKLLSGTPIQNAAIIQKGALSLPNHPGAPSVEKVSGMLWLLRMARLGRISGRPPRQVLPSIVETRQFQIDTYIYIYKWYKIQNFGTQCYNGVALSQSHCLA